MNCNKPASLANLKPEIIKDLLRQIDDWEGEWSEVSLASYLQYIITEK